MIKLSAPGAPFQYAWHVPKLEEAAEYWANDLGVGPFFLNEMNSEDYEGFRYRGGNGTLQMRLAWAQSKEGQIELIEVKSILNKATIAIKKIILTKYFRGSVMNFPNNNKVY